MTAHVVDQAKHFKKPTSPANGPMMEREWSANGAVTDREWSANGAVTDR
jgi:hypothetical protein